MLYAAAPVGGLSEVILGGVKNPERLREGIYQPIIVHRIIDPNQRTLDPPCRKQPPDQPDILTRRLATQVNNVDILEIGVLYRKIDRLLVVVLEEQDGEEPRKSRGKVIPIAPRLRLPVRPRKHQDGIERFFQIHHLSPRTDGRHAHSVFLEIRQPPADRWLGNSALLRRPLVPDGLGEDSEK